MREDETRKPTSDKNLSALLPLCCRSAAALLMLFCAPLRHIHVTGCHQEW